MTSQYRHKSAILNLRPPSRIPSLQLYSRQRRDRKIHEFVLRNILNQNKHKKVKDYLLLTNEGEKLKKDWKKTENSQNTLQSRRLLWKRHQRGHNVSPRLNRVKTIHLRWPKKGCHNLLSFLHIYHIYTATQYVRWINWQIKQKLAKSEDYLLKCLLLPV